ncbi:enamine deaminase RidA (YjgF/YER057c/UK114 family) [Natronocella acetinitrilica]|uniref:Enamine deaminase RidA (YjgF/YER057c/UK114 family) n=1 Tax=Natronocella acetinitrilica TaxID=414046 RepID=A0AAE3G8A6_9GAMM|nr:Rid family hydrolase [Natronocella acetinitrilica]MCP1677267.1 enamine deaminase RidA (YjgF/YER057c/UK114 family) [Natronocella acetinitrilica]
MIERISGVSAGRSSATAWQSLVWAVATAGTKSESIEQQTLETLSRLDANLEALGANKHDIVSATVYLSDIANKSKMDTVWCQWIGPDPSHWPQRACVGVALAPGDLVEIVAVAVKPE